MKKILIILAIVVITPVVWWLAAPIFIDDVVDEEIIVTAPQDSVEDFSLIESDLITGDFIDADKLHKASGKVYISGSDVSLVDFDSTNVPDGRLYLATDTEASNFIDLGELKGNKGNQNYVIPDEVSIDDYNQVLVWCRAFSILVGSAEI